MYKIKIKDPERENELLTFTTEKYSIENNTISFIDKFGTHRIFNINLFIGAEEVKQ